MATKLSNCNNALLLVGADEMNTLEDETREARICNSIYEDVRDGLITRYTWSFSLAQKSLSRIADIPLFDYKYAYQLPVEPRFLRMVRKNSPRNDYHLYEDLLYTDDDAVQIIYQFPASEKNHPPYFTQLLIYELAKVLAIALMQDETMATLMDKMSEKEFMRAKHLDAQNNPPPAIDDREFSLTAVR